MTVVESVGWVLVHFLWQGAAIAALLRLVVALAAPSRPALRYALGCGALALMLVAPLLTAAGLAPEAALQPAPVSLRDALPASDEISSAAAAAARPATPHPRSGTLAPERGEGRVRGLIVSIRLRVTAMLPWFVSAWAIGVMLLSVRLAGGWWRTRALRTHGIEAMPDVCHRMIERLLELMRIARPVAFFVSSRVTAPIVFGHVKPIVLVPAAVLAGLSPSQLEAILAHELAHVRRHDYLVNLLQTVIETVLFYHPAVWWVSRQVRQAREECCDDLAVAACGDRRDYVEALLGLAQMRDAAATAALGATGGSLLARARRLLADTEREGTSPRLTASAIAIAVAGIALAGMSSMAATEPVMVTPLGRPLASLASSPSSSAAPEASSPSDQQEEIVQRKLPPPQPVIAAPDGSAPFAARREWAEREAKTRGASRYWLGYSIRPVKGLHPVIYFDRETMVMTSGGVRISGHFFSDRMDGLQYPGQPLAIPNADPSAIKVLFLLESRGGSPRLSRVHASTLPLPFDAHGRPIFWIGGADTASSIALIDGFYAGASTGEARNDLINTAGIHDDSPAVVAWLERRVQGSEGDEIRSEAVEALAWHPIPAALAALERAARQDRASKVRQEAAEALGDLEMPEAAPVLEALAKSLDDREARREAIEALGERPEMSARDTLAQIVRDDADVDLQREAVETLGDFKDDRGVPLLREILRSHPRADVRREALETLVDSMASADALALLREVIQSNVELDVRREAVERLADVKDAAASTVLIEIARTHAIEDLRAEAAESLADLKPSAEIVPALKQIAMSDNTLRVRGEAIEALADLPDAQGIDALIEIARDHTDRDTRKKAVEVLADSEHPKARKFLEQVLMKPSGE